MARETEGGILRIESSKSFCLTGRRLSLSMLRMLLGETSRKGYMATSFVKADKSALEYPSNFWAIVTIYVLLILLFTDEIILFSCASRAARSGSPMYIRLVILRKAASSRSKGLLVAPMTKILP